MVSLQALDLRGLIGTLGPVELVILLVIIVALLLLGPTKLPELARGMGRAIGEFRRGKEELEREMRRELAETSPRKPPVVRNDLMRAAEELGVRTEGREERDIKLEIVRAMDRESPQRVMAAAKVLGISGDDANINDVKMSIIRAINI
jgi:sec-independent protein translocase protein TatA